MEFTAVPQRGDQPRSQFRRRVNLPKIRRSKRRVDVRGPNEIVKSLVFNWEFAELEAAAKAASGLIQSPGPPGRDYPARMPPEVKSLRGRNPGRRGALDTGGSGSESGPASIRRLLKILSPIAVGPSSSPNHGLTPTSPAPGRLALRAATRSRRPYWFGGDSGASRPNQRVGRER